MRGTTAALIISALILIVAMLFFLLLRAVSGPSETKVVTQEVTREVTVGPPRTQPPPKTAPEQKGAQ